MGMMAMQKAGGWGVTMLCCLQEPFDRRRLDALNYIKADGKKWIAAHARGGSAPGQAAKRMYVAVDAVLGHVSGNGAAPLPKGKAKQVQETLKEVETLLQANK
jgi:hypothetical protein